MTQPRPARALAGAACLAVACAVTGCSSTSSSSSSITATGHSLAVYLSEPASPDATEQSVFNAESRACAQDRTQVTDYTVTCVKVQKATLPDNARTAIQNKSTIAYVGEIGPGTTEQSVGITNALDILEVSPTDTALELTTATSAVPKAPDEYFESLSSYGYTFARVVPDGTEEATAVVAEMRSLHVKSLFVSNDGSDYGKAIAHAVAAAASPGISVTAQLTGANAYFYGATSSASAAKALAAAAKAQPEVKLFGPSALADTSPTSTLGSQVRNLYISVPSAASAPRTASPARAEAAYGAEAVAAVFHVLQEAGESADDRAIVVKDFKAIANRSSAIGTYSIDKAGNTNLSTFQFYRLSAGSLVPVTSSRG